MICLFLWVGCLVKLISSFRKLYRSQSEDQEMQRAEILIKQSWHSSGADYCIIWRWRSSLPCSNKRDLKHRQRNGRRRRFATEADWAKGFVFGGENEVQAVQLPSLPRRTTTFSLRRTLSCYSLIRAFKDPRNLHFIRYEDGLRWLRN